MSIHNLDKIFKPESAAIIWASEKEGSIGFSLLKNVGKAEYQRKILENGHAGKKLSNSIRLIAAQFPGQWFLPFPQRIPHHEGSLPNAWPVLQATSPTHWAPKEQLIFLPACPPHIVRMPALVIPAEFIEPTTSTLHDIDQISWKIQTLWFRNFGKTGFSIFLNLDR